MADVEDSDQDDEELVDSMGELQEIQGELAKVKEEEKSQVLEVKRKYNEFRKPLYNRRNELIQSISGFWVTAFLSHPVLADHVSEEDKKIFKYMVSLEVEDFKDVQSGYSITFNFSPNPFFEGKKLTKTYSFSEDGTTNITSTTIKWKDDENIASGSAQENKGAKRRVTIDSFFSWFREEQKIIPIGVTDAVATIIKEELWSDPLNYFSNEADEEDFNEGDSDDDDDNDNDHDDEEDEEDFSRSRSHSNDDDNDPDNEEDEEDFSQSPSHNNDDDNDREDEEDEEDVNVSGSDDDEVINESESTELDEIEEQYDVVEQYDEEEIEEQDDGEIEEQDDEGEIEEQDDVVQDDADDEEDDDD